MNEAEFKAQLFETFRKNGVEAEIKHQVTEKLVQKFKTLAKEPKVKGTSWVNRAE